MLGAGIGTAGAMAIGAAAIEPTRTVAVGLTPPARPQPPSRGKATDAGRRGPTGKANRSRDAPQRRPWPSPMLSDTPRREIGRREHGPLHGPKTRGGRPRRFCRASLDHAQKRRRRCKGDGIHVALARVKDRTGAGERPATGGRPSPCGAKSRIDGDQLGARRVLASEVYRRGPRATLGDRDAGPVATIRAAPWRFLSSRTNG